MGLGETDYYTQEVKRAFKVSEDKDPFRGVEHYLFHRFQRVITVLASSACGDGLRGLQKRIFFFLSNRYAKILKVCEAVACTADRTFPKGLRKHIHLVKGP